MLFGGLPISINFGVIFLVYYYYWDDLRSDDRINFLD